MRPFALLLTGLLLLYAGTVSAITYEVRPNTTLDTIGEVPWELLGPGDTVLIYWRPATYNEKWVINRRGSPSAPITVRGVPGPNGERPIIDGSGATTRFVLDFPAEGRGIIKIGASFNPPDVMPQYITIENLEIRNARGGLNFSSQNGPQQYANNAAAIYLEKGQFITIRNCILRDCGMGLFAGGTGSNIPSIVVIERCFFVNNGALNDVTLHNAFTECIGLTCQFNRFGLLRAGARGDNLRDQSAGAVIRYNWIEGGDHQLNLLESTNLGISASPGYNSALVYGNTLIEYNDQDRGSNSIIQFGGQGSSTNIYRQGPLYFYNNTVVSYLTDRTILFNLPTNEQFVDSRNNIVFIAPIQPRSLFRLLNNFGILNHGNSWYNTGWGNFVQIVTNGGVVSNFGGIITGDAPGFTNFNTQDFSLLSNSVAVNRGGPLHPDVVPANDVLFQYVPHLNGRTRPNTPPIDLGAFERVAPLAVEPRVWNSYQ